MHIGVTTINNDAKITKSKIKRTSLNAHTISLAVCFFCTTEAPGSLNAPKSMMGIWNEVSRLSGLGFCLAKVANKRNRVP